MSKTLSVTRNKDGDVDLRDIVVSADGKSCSVEQMLEAWVICRQQIADKDAEIADLKRQLEEARKDTHSTKIGAIFFEAETVREAIDAARSVNHMDI